MRELLDNEYENKILLAEVCEPPEEAKKYFGDNDEFQMVLDFLLVPAMFISLKTGKKDSIENILQKIELSHEEYQWCMFIRNHDQLWLRRSVDSKYREFMYDEYAPDPNMRSHDGIARRLAPLVDNDQRKMELLFSLISTLKGTPLIYYGMEIGMGDDNSLKKNSRKAIRTAMQWSDEKNAGFTSAEKEKIYSSIIDFGEYGYSKLNLESQRKDKCSLYNVVRKMLETRKKYKVFGRGNIVYLHPDNDSILAYVREFKGERFLILNNFSASEESFILRSEDLAGCGSTDVLNEDESSLEVDSKITMKPYGYLWLKLS
jgi:maltose alpha-D-glucosyltransferase/alpha-amylase